MKYPFQFCIAGNPDKDDGGAFKIPYQGKDLFVITSHGGGWNHVSVSLENRCPEWNEMCFVKDLFFDAEDCVIQYHPPKSKYINHNFYVLHLWQPQGIEIPMPPVEYV